MTCRRCVTDGRGPIREFFRFLWERFVRRSRNIGYGTCRWNCERLPRRRILLDEGMCPDCYFNDYVMRYK